MGKNMVSIILENLLPESQVDTIMDFHGGVDAWLPDKAIEKVPKKVKELMRKGNFKFTEEEYSDDEGGGWVEKFVEIKVDKSNIQNIIDKNVRVEYGYEGRKKYIWAENRFIEKIEGNYIWTDHHNCLCLDKFDYLKISVMYSDEFDFLDF